MTKWHRILELSCRATFTLVLVLLTGVMFYLVLGARPAEAPIRILPVRDVAPMGAARLVDRPQVLTMLATAYSHGCGNGDGFTATMTRPRPGVVAVDPRVIPLGTELYVEDYGPARAEDTGGAIKGHQIDVFFDCPSRALEWGRKTVRVEVLE